VNAFGGVHAVLLIGRIAELPIWKRHKTNETSDLNDSYG